MCLVVLAMRGVCRSRSEWQRKLLEILRADNWEEKLQEIINEGNSLKLVQKALRYVLGMERPRGRGVPQGGRKRAVDRRPILQPAIKPLADTALNQRWPGSVGEANS